MQMNTRLRNRRAASSLLTGYVQGLIISQDLAKNICEAEVDENYLVFVEELSEKLAAMKKTENGRGRCRGAFRKTGRHEENGER